MHEPNKQECLFMAGFSSLVMFVGKVRSSWQNQHSSLLGHIHNTLFSLQVMNEPNMKECLFLASFSSLV